jgi:hypothetical protein
MASEILGLFTSPEEYQMRQQQAQQQGQQNAALQFAQLNPFEKANYGIFQGAQQLGSAGRRLFGGDDPQLRIISERQKLTKDIDPSDPQSILNAAMAAAEMPGQQGFAFALADYARKAQSEKDLARQRSAVAERETKQAIPAEIALASAKGDLDIAIDRMSKMEQSPQVREALNNAKILRAAYDKEGPTTNEMKNADAFALRKGPRGSPEYNTEFDSRMEKFTSKADRVISYGTDRDATAKAKFGKIFADLTQEEQQTVNDIVDKAKEKVAEASATKLPGQGKEGVKDIPGFRDKLIQNVDPFRKTITSSDQGIRLLDASIKTGNFNSFKAARTQLAKTLDSGTLSRNDIESAGGDPSILGGTIDWLSTKITATPSLDTQNKMRATLVAINKLARQKGQAELDVQRNMAKRIGFDQQDIDLIFDIPEFRSKDGKTPSGNTPAKGQKTITTKRGTVVTVETE